MRRFLSCLLCVARSKVIYVLTACVLLVSAAGAQQAFPDFEEVAEGVEFRQVQFSTPRPVTMIQLRCDPSKIKFSILLASDLKVTPKAQATTASVVAKELGQIAVLNSSYFGHRQEVLGYTERLGHVLNSEVAEDGLFSAFFYWDGKRAGLKRRGEPLPKKVPVLFQCGPRLVWDSKVVEGLDNKAKANRSGVAIDSQGRAILFAVGGTSVLTLAELPDLLLNSAQNGGVGAVRALNFDGGSSSQFSLQTHTKSFTLPGLAKVPVFLGVSRR